MEADGRPDLGDGVAPSAGAWIEIVIFRRCLPALLVAPLVGAWIEMIHVL